MNCPLCRHPGAPLLKEEFYVCSHCSGIFRNRENLIGYEEEKKRYEHHNNDVNDPGYQKFVSPITSFVLSNFSPQSFGLDFGSGTGPVISKILKENDYNIQPYDPFFANDQTLLSKSYDYIVCCEVIEHFHNPHLEFKQLYKMLQPGGILICMTHLYSPDINFASWYYKNDPTHVFIYQAATVQYLAGAFLFQSVEVDNRLIVLRK